MQNKFILFSVIMFLLIFIWGSGAFVILMERILHDSSENRLIQNIEVKQLKLEALVNSEIAIVLKMADSPLIKRYFTNPADSLMEKMAFEELAAYRQAFATQSLFWINNIDHIFYSGEYHAYKIDPENPDNYWYYMTLYKTEVYNFNINYNPDLHVTNLWINAPVFNSEHIPIGMVGTGINLSDFIKKIYQDYTGTAEMYFFNAAGEITGAKNIDLVRNKVSIGTELGETGAHIFAETKNLTTREIKRFDTSTPGVVAAFGPVPALGWYITEIQHFGIGDSLKTGMTVLFAVMMIVILATFVVFNVFVAGLLNPLNKIIKRMGQITTDWNLTPQDVYNHDEIKTLGEFLEMTITMIHDKLKAERKAHESDIAKIRAEAAREAIISSIEYAGRIQRSLLPPECMFAGAFREYCVTWKPRDIVGGDIYWLKQFDDGVVLCVCDCTGHGTPGALLTMLIVSALENLTWTDSGKDTARIIWRLEQRFVEGFSLKANEPNKNSGDINGGCDIAVLFIARDGSITMSAGNMNLFVCDGMEVRRIKGQKIYIGEGLIKSRDEIKTVFIPANPDNKFYIASDGLYGQPGGKHGIPFGYEIFKKVILKNHYAELPVISARILEAFEEHRGTEPRVDDIELITFKP